jgi:hypothetical protein
MFTAQSTLLSNKVPPAGEALVVWPVLLLAIIMRICHEKCRHQHDDNQTSHG